MSKIKVSIGDVYSLNSELSGIINQGTGERITNGLLSAELSIVTKFKLNSLLGSIAPYVKSVDDLKNSLIEKYGKADADKGKVIDFYIKDSKGHDVINPSMEKFQKEMSDLYLEEVEIEFMDINIDDLDFKTTEFYPVMFKIIGNMSNKK